MKDSFHNTTALSGSELKEVKDEVAKQDDLIKAIFESNPKSKYSPDQILEIFQRDYQLTVLLTSIRRSISNLTDEGYLTKLKKEEQIIGMYGKKVNRWQWNVLKKFSGIQLVSQDIFNTPNIHPHETVNQ